MLNYYTRDIILINGANDTFSLHCQALPHTCEACTLPLSFIHSDLTCPSDLSLNLSWPKQASEDQYYHTQGIFSQGSVPIFPPFSLQRCERRGLASSLLLLNMEMLLFNPSGCPGGPPSHGTLVACGPI